MNNSQLSTPPLSTAAVPTIRQHPINELQHGLLHDAAIHAGFTSTYEAITKLDLWNLTLASAVQKIRETEPQYPCEYCTQCHKIRTLFPGDEHLYDMAARLWHPKPDSFDVSTYPKLESVICTACFRLNDNPGLILIFESDTLRCIYTRCIYTQTPMSLAVINEETLLEEYTRQDYDAFIQTLTKDKHQIY